MKLRQSAIRTICVVGIIVCAVMAAGRMMKSDSAQEKQAGHTKQNENKEDVERMTDFAIEDAAAGAIVNEAMLDRSRLEDFFVYHEITEEVFRRINGRSYQEGGDVSLADLRYLKVLHYNFAHEIQVGEMIANAQISEELCAIFRELFEAEYEIESMRLIDDYWAGDGTTSDEASVAANNSSAFCYRVIAGTTTLSRHAYGYAVDINPKQNPYVVYANGIPGGYPDYSREFVKREKGKPHVITDDDVCCGIFKAHGFTWGGDWMNPKDYQHFEW